MVKYTTILQKGKCFYYGYGKYGTEPQLAHSLEQYH